MKATDESISLSRRILLRNFQSPGDIVVLTAAVRDLHHATEGQIEISIESACDALWQFNPYVKPREEGAVFDATIECEYPLVHQSNQRPYHFLHGFVQDLEAKLGIRIPVTAFKGDLHLSEEEKSSISQVQEMGIENDFWILMAGGKYDFTAKWWDPAAYQAVVDHFARRITFVQCGEAGHWHPPLKGVVNLIGKTDTRQFLRLIYHSVGVVCPVTFAMHAAAAVPVKPGRPPSRACVVIAGGREPTHWEAYPNHRFLSNTGTLPCSAEGGCWKSRCQKVGDSDEKDHFNTCERPVQISEKLVIPRCMEMIRPGDVIRAIESHYEGGMLKYNASPETTAT